MYETKTIFEDDDCKVSLEELEGKLFVHVKLFRATRPVLDKLQEIWAAIRDKCYWLGYEAIYTYTKEPRMVKFFPGSEFLGGYDYKGEKYGVYQWALN